MSITQPECVFVALGIQRAKTGHLPHSSTLVVICVLLCIVVYKFVLPPGDNTIAVNKYIISYHVISYHIMLSSVASPAVFFFKII